MTNLLSKSFLKFTSSLLVLVVAGAVFGQASRKNRFDPDGSFWVLGEKPSGFSDFGGINLNAKRARHLPKAGLDLVNGKRFPFKVLSVKQERFTFTTVRVSGISYGFVGRFLKGGVFGAGDLDDETPVLEGTITKYKVGKRVAQSKLSFVYFGGT
jgi:hypothetical protein